jgi:hypothetical protein
MPLAEENSEESMRASRSRKKFLIRLFQLDGVFWTT